MPTYIARCANGFCASKEIDVSELDDGGEADAIGKSVGKGGANQAGDVTNVQTRLNRVPQNDGGPVQSLVIDGLCGSKTNAAILRFQQRHYRELLGDGRIDPDKNTWKKLLALSGSMLEAKAGDGASSAGSDDEATQQLFATFLYLARWRVYEAIKCLDEALSELSVLIAHCGLHPGTTLHAAYVHWEIKMKELPTVDRCFHIVNPTMQAAGIQGILRRLRKVFTDMLEVIAANSITTPAAEKNGSRRFLRVTKQAVLDRAHPTYGKDGVLADAAMGGWWLKNANLGRIRYGTAHVDKTNAFSTLIHEMAHYVSHASTYFIGDQGGYYHKAFKASPFLALRTAECYSWYALLASFKTLRKLPDNALPKDI